MDISECANQDISNAEKWIMCKAFLTHALTELFTLMGFLLYSEAITPDLD